MRGKTSFLILGLILGGTAAGCNDDSTGSADDGQADQATQNKLAGVYRLDTPAGQSPTAGEFRLLVLGKDGEALRQEVPAGAEPCTTTTVLAASYKAKPNSSTDRAHGKIDLVFSFIDGGELVEKYDYELAGQDETLRLSNQNTGQSFEMSKSEDKDRDAREGEACLALLDDARIDCADGLACVPVCGSDRADTVCRVPADLTPCPESFECSGDLACVPEQQCLATGDPDGDPPDCPGFCVIDGRDLDTVDDGELVRILALRVPSDKFAFVGSEFEQNVEKIQPAELPADIDVVMDSVLAARVKAEKDNGFREFEMHVVDEMVFRLVRDGRVIGFVITTSSSNGLEDGNLPGNRMFFNTRGWRIEDIPLALSEVGP